MNNKEYNALDMHLLIHAHWIQVSGDFGDEYECSNCHNTVPYHYTYCPNCPAKMDENMKELQNGRKN